MNCRNEQWFLAVQTSWKSYHMSKKGQHPVFLPVYHHWNNTYFPHCFCNTELKHFISPTLQKCKNFVNRLLLFRRRFAGFRMCTPMPLQPQQVLPVPVEAFGLQSVLPFPKISLSQRLCFLFGHPFSSHLCLHSLRCFGNLLFPLSTQAAWLDGLRHPHP